jgi:hypothetical protein
MTHESEQERFRKKLAEWLGISYEDLEEYGEDVEAIENDNELEDYEYCIQFSSLTPQAILNKIHRIDDVNMVYFNLEELDL